MAQPRSRQEFNDQSNVNPIFHWINRLREDWSKPIGGYNPDKGTWFPPADDKYPKGSLTGKNKKKKK
jgi:hypothetical protein